MGIVSGGPALPGLAALAQFLFTPGRPLSCWDIDQMGCAVAAMPMGLAEPLQLSYAGAGRISQATTAQLCR